MSRPNANQGAYVPAGGDRFGQQRSVFGVMPFSIKVSSRDTGGGLLVIEQHNAYQGGPPRHQHLEQDEWFYVVHGDYLVEVGGNLHRLGPGDSILAPSGVPHTWALDGAAAGRILIALQPALTMEAFFEAASKLPAMPTSDELRPLFEAHGMTIVGPPLRGG